MSEPRIQNLSKAVHHKQAQRMVNPSSHGRIHTQLHHPLCHPEDSILSHDGIRAKPSYQTQRVDSLICLLPETMPKLPTKWLSRR